MCNIYFLLQLEIRIKTFSASVYECNKENGKYLFQLRVRHMCRIPNCNKVEIQIEKLLHCSE